MSSSVSPGSPEHHVELQLLHPMYADQLGGAQQVPLLGLALDQVAHPLGGAVGGGGERPVAAPLEQADDLVVQPIGAEAGDADLAARLDDEAQDLRQPRVVGDRRADQPDPAGVGGDQRLAPCRARPAASRRWSTGASRSRCSRGGSRARARSGTCSRARCAASGSASRRGGFRRAPATMGGRRVAVDRRNVEAGQARRARRAAPRGRARCGSRPPAPAASPPPRP